MRYIGSKIRLLDQLSEFISKNVDGDEETFLDLFAGTSVVGNYFKSKYTIYSNDILYFCFCLSKATIENSSKLEFSRLKQIGITNPIDYLNNLETQNEIGYYESAYTTSGPEGRMYFSVENGKKIDLIRDKIEDWKSLDVINDFEYYYLISSLLEAVSLVSNTTGTYGAYLKKWDKRALKPLKLEYFPITNNKRKNIAYNEDANSLIKKINADIIYIDPPYNSRQYASNYHVLENIATHKKPLLYGVTGLMNYDDKKSEYSMKSKVKIAFDELINNANCRHLFLSYNSEGLLTEEEIYSVLKKYSLNDKVIVKEIDFNRYNSKINSKKAELKELIFYIKKCDQKKLPHSSTKNTSYEQIVFPFENFEYIKSPLNYIGGKFRILDQIIPLFPNKIDTFVDLFSGGANVGINAKANKYIFNDMNTKLNEMFRYFKNKDPESLINEIENIITTHGLSKTNEQAYLDFRELYNKNQNPLYLYIVSSFSYNYQIRFNNNMKYNNPFGRNRSHFSINMKNNLAKFINRINYIKPKFTDYYFQDFDFLQLTENDFVYLDPPYLITTGNYNDGNRGFKNWRIDEEEYMYELLNKLHKRNIKWALSNVIEHKGNTNDILLKFLNENNQYVVNSVNNSFSNSSYNTSRQASNEVLITNYDVYTGAINK